MSTITMPTDLGRQLARARECVRVCDEAGNTLGVFTPAAHLVLEPAVGEEELDRREKEGPFYTTKEVLAHLLSL